ncbi:MAG: hypothetical protein ISN29_00675 [Gammaproteobacteria bacterium AqS3]|nr:hypothetical protein [Gammaproteobacteria bacterium AqS3]
MQKKAGRDSEQQLKDKRIGRKTAKNDTQAEAECAASSPKVNRAGTWRGEGGKSKIRHYSKARSARHERTISSEAEGIWIQAQPD